jgi:Fe-S-cluster-containing dehydrogenase component/CRP-like cAMP-binding protein
MNPNYVERPRRWDAPFDPSLGERSVDDLLRQEPFSCMDASAFPTTLPLRGILKHDCRLVECQDGELIIRQGDYGNSAFLLLKGQAKVSLQGIPENILGRARPRRRTVLSSLAQLLRGDSIPEQRKYRRPSVEHAGAGPELSGPRRVFLQDFPHVIDVADMGTLGEGELFGELSAMTRTPRTATVFAHGAARLLEIRWQGLRDLMRFETALKQQIEQLYRARSLQTHLRELALFQSLPADKLAAVSEAIVFETYGNFEWQSKFQSTRDDDIGSRILGEPTVVERGDYVNGLILIRNGFARVCRQEESGYRTVAYLGKGSVFGWREVVHNWRTQSMIPWQLSLRAVGYLDVLRIPTRTVEELILPHIPARQLPSNFSIPNESSTNPTNDRRVEKRPESLDTPMLEFLVEERLINGVHAMLIDLNRCTRCDDCVRACAATHDGNPRFVRDGLRHEQFLIANACMHCADPVCMIGCPTGAISRTAADGIVTINDLTCIGCASCANSCPYGNIRMVAIRDGEGRPYVDVERNQPIVKATKCDLCAGQNGGPACQRACPHDALVRIDLTTADRIRDLVRE